MTSFSTPINPTTQQPIPLQLIRSPKRKRSLGMTITTKGITLRAPQRCPDRTIQQFLNAKTSRIQKQRSKVQKQADISTVTYDDNGIPLAMEHLGKWVPIHLKTHEKARATVHFQSNSTLLVSIPWMRLQDLQAQQEKMKQLLTRWQRLQAEEYLTRRTQVLNDELNLRVGRIIIKQYKRKYGQCKGNDISLDRKLVRFPVAISDHIIYHELAHLTHKHHQKSFRDLLKTYDPKTAQHKKRLREN